MFEKIEIRANRDSAKTGCKFTVWDAYGINGASETFIRSFHKLVAAQDGLAAYPQTAGTPVSVVK